MDLLGRYFSHVGGIARTDVVGLEYRLRATTFKTASGNTRKKI